MIEKTTGYILLIVGILLIILSAVSVYLVFTKQTPPVQLFSSSGISLDPGSLIPGGLPANLQGARPMAKQEIISADLLNQTSNLFAHVFLMGFIASAGQKLASLGIQLVRPIKIGLIK